MFTIDSKNILKPNTFVKYSISFSARSFLRFAAKPSIHLYYIIVRESEGDGRLFLFPIVQYHRIEYLHY